MYADPSGNFAISTFLITLAISSLVSWGLSEIFGLQIAGGIGSFAGGATAISTGINLCAFGPLGIAAGITMMMIGAGAIAFGTNEIFAGVTGNNYIQQWFGMSDTLYNGLYIGLNIASSAGTIVGNFGMKFASNRILNSIVKNPSQITNYKLWQIKAYGKYSSQYVAGVMTRSKSNPGGGYTLTHVKNSSYGYIQWHPGGGHHGPLAYWKITSSYNRATRFYYLSGIQF